MRLREKGSKNQVLSVFFGEDISTNIWELYGVYVITNKECIDMLYKLKTLRKASVEMETNYKNEILAKFPDPNSVGFPKLKGVEKTTTKFSESVDSESVDPPTPPTISLEFKKEVSKKLIKFFSEFTFIPAIRFTNTLSHCGSYANACRYINNYMSLCDHPDKDSIAEKLKCDEFKELIKDIFKCESDNYVNNRLEIYYGPAGTGKTTKAIEKYPNANITICNEMTDSNDIMRVFSFNDENGNPIFKPSLLQQDMINGNPHILDEMNLLPLSTLRFLQGILDGKKEFEYDGKIIEIADGFKIIGTMNLVVNGQVFSLPEPIVDRAENLECYNVNENILATCAF